MDPTSASVIARRTALRDYALVALASALVFFLNLGAAALWDEDEPLYASVAFDMMQRHDLVVPMFNGQLFAEKPPLAYWLMIAAYRIFGVTEFAARVWSALFGIGTALLTVQLGRRLFTPRTGFWAGMIVASTLLFTVSARAATIDSLLVFLDTAAIVFFVSSGAVRARTSEDDRGRPGSWTSFALLYACLGLAVLAKGPVGAILPIAAMALFVHASGQPADGWHARCSSRVVSLTSPRGSDRAGDRVGPTTRVIRWLGLRSVDVGACLRMLHPRGIATTVRLLRPVTALLVVGAIALPWYLLVENRTGGAFSSEFFGSQNFGRMMTAMQGHGGPAWYYLVAILVGFFPWSVFMTPAIIESRRQILRTGRFQAAHGFVACWVGLFVVAWSLPATKLPHYVLPVWPMLALATGWFIDQWLERRTETSSIWMHVATAITVLVGIVIFFLFPHIARAFVPGEERLAWIALPLVIGAVGFTLFSGRNRRELAMSSFAAAAIIFLAATFGLATTAIDRFQNARPLVATIRASANGDYRIAGYRFFSESLVFYAQRRVAVLHSPAEIRSFIERPGESFVVTTSEHEIELRAMLGRKLSVLARTPRFLRNGELVVLEAARPQGGRP